MENLPCRSSRYSKALALPISVEWTTQSPRRMKFHLTHDKYTNEQYAPVWTQSSLCTFMFGCEKSHPRTSTVAISMTEIWICEIQSSQRLAHSKRLQYVWTKFSRPKPALYRFVIMWLRHTLHGVGRPACHHERTRQTLITINRAIIVHCKNTKKTWFLRLSTKKHYR